MIFYQNGSIASHACAGIAIAEISVRLFMCPSVYPSHSDIVSKQTKLASFMVSSLMESAKTLIVFANIRFLLKFERGHLERGRFMRVGGYELARRLMGWRVLAFRQNCSEVCRAKHTASSKNVAGTLLYDDISFMGLFRRVPPKKGSVKQDKCFHCSHTCCSVFTNV